MEQYKILLKDDWLVQAEKENACDLRPYFTRCEESECVSVSLPARICDLFPKVQTPIWYYKHLETKLPHNENERVYLRFDRVVCLCEAWVNGIPVGKHNHSEEAFEFDITDALRERNLIALRVYGPVGDKVGPEGISMHSVPNYAQIYSYYTVIPMTGIYGEVCLYKKPLCSIEDLYVDPDAPAKTVNARLKLKNRKDRAECAEIEATIFEKGLPLASKSTLLPVDAGGHATATLCFALNEIRLWSPDDPYLYTLQIRVKTDSGTQVKQKRFGFKTLCVEDGWFMLNGKRIFLTCAHALESKEAVVHAKTMGFKALRYLAAMPSEEILDFCDEIGMLVYEECAVSWGMHDYPDMPTHMSAYLDNMILRDRSHVSVGIWGIFNEQAGPNARMRSRKLRETSQVFDFAVSYLPQLRRLDQSRLILLSSGRWDARRDVGSFSNPHSLCWNCGWGEESTEASSTQFQKAPTDLDPYIDGLGDNHLYPTVPLQNDVRDFVRNIAANSKPVFLSEYGVGYQLELYDLYQEEIQASHKDHPRIPYYAVQIRHLEEWIQHYSLTHVYPCPRDFLMASVKAGAEQRRESIDPIRANPKLCGYSMTSFSIGNEGVYFRKGGLIPGITDALRDSFAPLKWSIFLDRTQLYANTPFQAQFVLCNEDVLEADQYTATVSLRGTRGVVFQKNYSFSYPEGKPLAASVIRAQLPALTADRYTLSVHLNGQRQPTCNTKEICVHQGLDGKQLKQYVYPMGDLKGAKAFLQDHGVCFSSDPEEARIVAVGTLSPEEGCRRRKEIFDLAQRGKQVILLDAGFWSDANTSNQDFMQSIDYSTDQERTRFGTCIYVRNWLYHMDSYVADPQVFDGLADLGLLDMERFRRVYPDHYLTDTAAPDATYCASFGSGLFSKDSCIGALSMGSFSLGKGSVTVNTFKLLENVGSDPVADRLVYNLFSLL